MGSRAVSKPSSSYRTTAKSDSNGLVKASLATVIPSEDLDQRSVHLSSINSGARANEITANKDATEDASDEGTKRVSQASIENIRNNGNHVKINFDDKKNNSHLPASKALPPKQVKSYLFGRSFTTARTMI